MSRRSPMKGNISTTSSRMGSELAIRRAGPDDAVALHKLALGLARSQGDPDDILTVVDVQRLMLEPRCRDDRSDCNPCREPGRLCRVAAFCRDQPCVRRSLCERSLCRRTVSRSRRRTEIDGCCGFPCKDAWRKASLADDDAAKQRGGPVLPAPRRYQRAGDCVCGDRTNVRRTGGSRRRWNWLKKRQER